MSRAKSSKKAAPAAVAGTSMATNLDTSVTTLAGQIERRRFERVNREFYEGLAALEKMQIPMRDLVCFFPIYVGHVGIAKLLFFYELYKKCQDLAGHIADIGTWKGSSFFTFAKLVRIFEPHGYSQVHGFDWFQGMDPDPAVDNMENKGTCNCTFEEVDGMIECQSLRDVAILHKLDLANGLPAFFRQFPHLRFKMVFIDCGIANVIESCMEHFWPRLLNGGVLIMDHYNSDQSPSESALVDKYVGANRIMQVSFNRQPSAYVVKQG